eukprot:991444-Rhodomonas_salina.2
MWRFGWWCHLKVSVEVQEVRGANGGCSGSGGAGVVRGSGRAEGQYRMVEPWRFQRVEVRAGCGLLGRTRRRGGGWGLGVDHQTITQSISESVMG